MAATSDPSDAPPGPLGKTDIRTIQWDVSATTARLSVSLDASTYQTIYRAQTGLHVLLDFDRDGLADMQVVAVRSADGVSLDLQLRSLDRTLSTATCQDLSGKATASSATIRTSVSGGLESFQFVFDTSALSVDMSSFRWVAFGQSPPDTASGPWDYLPNSAISLAGSNPGDRRCGAAKTGIWADMSKGVDQLPAKPDGRIRQGSGPFVGNNVYNATAANQTATGSAGVGSTVTFGISIQNDGMAAGTFGVHAAGSASGYSVKYFVGTADRTAAVVAGTYRTPSLAIGGTRLLTAKVTVLSGAVVGSQVVRLVTITSTSSSAVDAVKFVAKRA
jgi:hypothetical protein